MSTTPAAAAAAAVVAPTLHRAMGLLQATATNVISMVGVGPFLTIPFMVAALDGLPLRALGRRAISSYFGANFPLRSDLGFRFSEAPKFGVRDQVMVNSQTQGPNASNYYVKDVPGPLLTGWAQPRSALCSAVRWPAVQITTYPPRRA